MINGFISFFNAIQSAIEYFREILEIVNDSSVARGDIKPGAEKMVQGLASSIPVAIGFLAKQVGLDNLGEKIAEMISTWGGKLARKKDKGQKFRGKAAKNAAEAPTIPGLEA